MGLISAITAILVVGYELQVKQVGVAISESNGQPAYETYVLAPYRLATVCGGLAVAYIWTIFPYPISESTELRKDLGAAIYLLANLYSVVHETVTSRIQRIDGDEDTKGTRAYHLEQARRKVFTKLLSLLTTLRQNSAFSKFQLRVGGRFPQEEYEGLIGCVERVLQYTALISYASGTFSTSAADSEWSVDFRKLLQSVDATSHQFTSLLSLLSSSLAHARPLPPYLEVPQHRRYVRSLEKIDHDILSVSHIAEPEYSAFAVIQICAQCINDDVVKMTRYVVTLLVVRFRGRVADGFVTGMSNFSSARLTSRSTLSARARIVAMARRRVPRVNTRRKLTEIKKLSESRIAHVGFALYTYCSTKGLNKTQSHTVTFHWVRCD